MSDSSDELHDGIDLHLMYQKRLKIHLRQNQEEYMLKYFLLSFICIFIIVKLMSDSSDEIHDDIFLHFKLHINDLQYCNLHLTKYMII